MAFVQYQTTVDWDSTLTDLGYTSDGYVESAVKTTTGAPTATAGKFITAAQILNKVSGITYTNTGTTASPVWSVLGGGGGGGMAIGDSIADADAGSILYVDGTGNLTQDVGFTRTSTGVTKVLSTFGPAMTEFQVSDNLFGLGFSGVGNKLSVGADSVIDTLNSAGGNLFKAVSMQFADGSVTDSNTTKGIYGVVVQDATNTNSGTISVKIAESKLVNKVASAEYGTSYLSGKLKFGHVNGSNYIEYDTITGLHKITNVPTYADDAAAISGGLTTGNLYKTTTGGITALNIVP